MHAQLCPFTQLEEDLADDLKWSMRVNKVLFSGKSEYQEVDLIDVGPFGKVRLLRKLKPRPHKTPQPKNMWQCCIRHHTACATTSPPHTRATGKLLHLCKDGDKPVAACTRQARSQVCPTLFLCIHKLCRHCSLTARYRAQQRMSGSTMSSWCTPLW